MKYMLLRIFGHGLTLIFGDTLVLDRWRWLKRYLPRTAGQELLIDVGCGSGAFTLGAAKLGYRALGLSWDERNNAEAKLRAKVLHLDHNASFDVLDVRRLDQLETNRGEYSFVVNCENIEHIVDDSKLIKDAYDLLVPGGRLLLTTPNYYFKALDRGDDGPYEPIEDGRHVRRGYSRIELIELLEFHGFLVETVEYCSGYFSQKITSLLRALSRVSGPIAWVIALPLRVLPGVFDRPRATGNPPGFSICVVALKPRFSDLKIQSGADRATKATSRV